MKTPKSTRTRTNYFTISLPKIQAQTDQIYLENGVTLSEEIRESRFGGDKYSFETTVSESDDFDTNDTNGDNTNADSKEK